MLRGLCNNFPGRCFFATYGFASCLFLFGGNQIRLLIKQQLTVKLHAGFRVEALSGIIAWFFSHCLTGSMECSSITKNP